MFKNRLLLERTRLFIIPQRVNSPQRQNQQQNADRDYQLQQTQLAQNNVQKPFVIGENSFVYNPSTGQFTAAPKSSAGGTNPDWTNYLNKSSYTPPGFIPN